MASELFSAIEGQYSIKALQNILANLENVNLKNSRGETALAAVIRLYTDRRPRKGVDFQEFESYILKAVQLFIDAGVDVNLKSLDGQSVIEALMTSNYRGEKLLEILEILIEAGADVNSKNEDGCTGLHLAANNNNPNQVGFIRLLLQHGVDIDSQDHRGFTALHRAIQCQNKEVVVCLIEAGAYVNLKNEDGQTALHLAADNYYPNQVDFIRFLLQQDGVDVDLRDRDGFTALHRAVKKKNKGIIQCLIDAGADINKKTPNGETPLHLAADAVYVDYAVQKQNKEVVECLIEAGAHVNLKNRHGQSVMEALITSSYRGVQLMLEILEVLIKAGADVKSKNSDGQTVLHLAAMDIYNQIDFIRLLLKHRADVDSQDDFKFTALQYAVQKQNKEVVECLIDAGANVNSKNEDGQTALHLAVKKDYNRVDIIRLLIERGADVDSQDESGFTVLQYAVQEQNKEVVECLIDAGVDVNLKNKNGQTALHLAVNNSNPNQVSFIRLLLQRDGVDVDSQDCDGLTALHRAVQRKNKDVIQCLIEARSDINRKTPNGKTPLYLAAQTVNVDLIKYLITRGADVNAKDGTTGKTPLHNLMNQGFGGDKLLDALEVLLSAGADVNAVELSQNETPLHGFMHLKKKISESFFRILKIFIKYRADFKIKNRKNETPMDIFLRNCYRFENDNYSIILLETLIKYGIMDVESYSWIGNGQTRLHLACLSLNYKMIKYFVNHGVNIEVKDRNMKTPLLLIIKGLIDDRDGTSKNPKILDYFLSLNPDINIISNNGLHILNLGNYSEFLWKALIEYIAKKQSTGFLLHETILHTISEKVEYKTYLEKCTKELKSVQELKFPSSGVNLRDILLDHEKKLDCYVKNVAFTKEFNELFLAEKFPIYGLYIVKKISKALQKQEVMEKSAVILSSCLPFHMDPSHLVIEKIIGYLKGKYLRYLCEPESEESIKIRKIDEFKISFDKYVGSYYKIE